MRAFSFFGIFPRAAGASMSFSAPGALERQSHFSSLTTPTRHNVRWRHGDHLSQASEPEAALLRHRNVRDRFPSDQSPFVHLAGTRRPIAAPHGMKGSIQESFE
jgi:hypothetical protein